MSFFEMSKIKSNKTNNFLRIRKSQLYTVKVVICLCNVHCACMNDVLRPCSGLCMHIAQITIGNLGWDLNKRILDQNFII